jgi:tetratricopeptide (TPR) repeat protein
MGAQHCGVLLAAVLLAAPAAAQNAVPPLPRLAIESYPAAAREAIARVHQNATARPNDPDAVGALARVLHAWEQWEPAHETYTRAQSLAPRAFEWHYLDGVVLQRLARHAEAAARFKAALALSPGYLPARSKLADALFESGSLEESGRLFDDLAREPAAEPVAQLGLGRIAAAQGRHEVAIVHLRRAIDLFPEFGPAYYALALSSRALGRSDDAQRAIERHAQYGPRWPAIEDPVLRAVTTLRDDARAMLQRGVKLAAAGDVQEAIAAHEAALARDPSLTQAHANLISLYGRAGDYAKAEEHYHATVSGGLNLADTHYEYGLLLAIQGKWDLAADAFRRALSINPLHAQAQNSLGQLLERQRNFEAAAVEYRHAVETQPAFRQARFNLGRMLLALGRNDEAVAAFEKLLEPRDAETPRYLFALATAHVRSGHKDEGIRLATQARQLAVDYGQHDLAAAIDRDLASIK